MSADAAPAEIVGLLNELFSRFDQLAEHHGLEKIKTIGDAYMVAGGIPVARDDHAEAVAEMALDMVAEIDGRHDGRGLQIRIGIDTGPVGRGDRPAEVHLRPLGRHGEHRQSYGVTRPPGRHPGD
jgi:class 3 adenylate cyclase